MQDWAIKFPYALALATITCSSLGAEDASRLEELLALDLSEILEVNVATGTKKQVSDAPAVVSVITSDDIKAMGVRTLAEAVERIPGLHVGASANRLIDLYTVRGLQSTNTPQILVLIDGVEISELTAFSVPYAFRYPINAIERIEVIRGPGSAVYGADAFSGVINIITRTPGNEDNLQVGINYGSFDYLEAWVNSDWVYEDFRVGLSITRETQNNDSNRRTQYGVLDRRRDLDNIHLNVAYKQFIWRNWYWRADQQMGVGAGLSGNTLDRDESTSWKTQLNWQDTLAKDIEGAFDVSYTRFTFDALFQLFPAGVWPVGDDGNLFQPPFTPINFPDGVIGHPKGESARAKINGSIISSRYDSHRIRLGIGAEDFTYDNIRETKNFGPGVLDVSHRPANLISDRLLDVTGTEFIYSPPYDRQLFYVSFQDEWKISDKVELTAGVRHDRFSDFGSTTNPRLAFVWHTTESLTSKVLYGTAFRAPRAAELVFINNPATLGNPDLQPEEISTVEFALDYRPSDRFTGLLNIFSYKANELIQLDQTFTYINQGEQDGRGIEVEANWQASDNLRISANFSWLDAELPLIDDEKSQVPGFMGFFDIRYQVSENWLLTSQSYWISDRLREANDDRLPVDDYLKTDVTLLWQANDNWTMRFSVRNLFDDRIIQPSPDSGLFAIRLGFPDDFPMETRNIFGSVTYSF